MDPFPNLDVDNILLHSSINTFKNNGVFRDKFVMPDSHTNGVQDTLTLTFTLQNDTDFVQLLVYATDYAKYFRYLDSQYHNKWQPIEQSLDFLLLNNPVTQLFYFNINYKIDGDQVTITLTVPAFFSSFNILPSLEIPVAFVEYTLAK